MKKQKNIKFQENAENKGQSCKINSFISLKLSDVHGGAAENENSLVSPQAENINDISNVAGAALMKEGEGGDWSTICKRFTLGSCEESEPCCDGKKFFEKKPKSKKFKQKIEK